MPTSDAIPSRFHPGELWTYHTRSQEPNSRLLILQVDPDPILGHIVHVRLIGLRLKNPHRPNGISEEIGHMPFSEQSLSVDANQLKLERESVPVPPDYKEGYAEWKQAFDAHKAGVFTIPLSETVDAMERGINTH